MPQFVGADSRTQPGENMPRKQRKPNESDPSSQPQPVVQPPAGESVGAAKPPLPDPVDEAVPQPGAGQLGEPAIGADPVPEYAADIASERANAA